MNSPPTFTIGCDTLVTFEEDVNIFDNPEQIAAANSCALVIPSTQALASARRFWLRVIRRLTEPIPDHKGHCRVRNSAEPNQGLIEILHGTVYSARASGNKLDISDSQCVILYRTENRAAANEGEGSQVCEIAIPIPWTELVNIQFELRRTRQVQPSNQV